MAFDQRMDRPGAGSSAPITIDKRVRQYCFLLILALLAGTTALRTIHLDADPAAWFINEIGYQIDEGYKTLAPRNLSLYGNIRWNAEDQYGGWMVGSAITQWPYYWAFKTLGTRLSSARMVSIAYAVLLLAISAAFLWHRHSPGLALAGVLLLTADPGLFLFSRSALFETALALFTYAALFATVCVPTRTTILQPVLLAMLTVPAFLFLKMSVLIYTAPAIFALALVAGRERMGPLLRRKSYLIAVTLAALALLAVSSYFIYEKAETLSRTGLALVLHRPQMLLLNPIESLSPLALCLGYIALLDMLVRRPDSILTDGYRLSLAFIIVLAPMALSLFIYNYPRYYIPIIPAALLMVVERLAMPATDLNGVRFRLPTLAGAFAVVVFLALAMTVWTTFNHYILANLPFKLGADPGLSQPALLKLYPLFLVLFAATTYGLLKLSGGRLNTALLRLLVGVQIVAGFAVSTIAVAWPSYRTQAIQERIVERVAPGESLGGDWAPYFVVGTTRHVLYMRPDVNGPGHIRAIRPDYFLFSDTAYDRADFARLAAMPGIELGKPVVLGEYANRPITLYRIRYADSDLPADNGHAPSG